MATNVACAFNAGMTTETGGAAVRGDVPTFVTRLHRGFEAISVKERGGGQVLCATAYVRAMNSA